MQASANRSTARCGAQSHCSRTRQVARLPRLQPVTRFPLSTGSVTPLQQQQLHVRQQQSVICRTQAQDTPQLEKKTPQLDGEDAAAFDVSEQSLRSWGIFGVLLTTVLGAMYLVSSSTAASNCGSVYSLDVMTYRTRARCAPIITLIVTFACFTVR